MKPQTIAFHHFGCKVNFAEASTLSRQFRERGYRIVDHREKADVYVISTCSVTTVAEKKCRAAIRQAHHLNPDARIAVIGCYSELKSAEIERIEGVSIILGHTGKFNLPDEIEKHSGGKPAYHRHLSEKDFIPSYSMGDRTRSFLKVQDGCDYFCSYCSIPFARGRSRSDSIENILAEVRKLLAGGIREIVLTGVNIGDFGKDRGESFFDLLERLDSLTGIPRIRLSSVEPDLLEDRIIELVASSGRLMPHFHIPLQSGSDRILKAMKRKYSRQVFASRVQKIRSLMPDACIAADVIAGFPGETDEDFRESEDFIRGLEISYLHVFSYSKRENTLAAKLGNEVPEKLKKQRSRILHSLSEEKKHAFYRNQRGTLKVVLFESDHSGGWMHGFTENYLKVRTKFNPEHVNRLVHVRLEELDGEEFVVTSDQVIR